jgi:predicted HicB family RNase H-like nuclease
MRALANRFRGVLHRLLAFGDVPPPNKPKTPTHSVRVPQELWDAVRAKAKRQGETVTDVIIRALKRYLRD